MGNGFDYTFDANQYQPIQFDGNHPVGMFDAFISNTAIEASKTFDGGNFVVEFTTPAGTIKKWYSLWHPENKKSTGAHNALSALSHATGIFKVSMKDEGAAFKGARCKIVVTAQVKKDADDPERTQIQKVLDINGNEPGKAPTNQSSAFGAQPSQPANNAAAPFNGAAPNAATASPAPANAWGAQGGAAPAGNAWQGNAGAASPAQQPWQQGGGAAGATDKPSWAK